MITNMVRFFCYVLYIKSPSHLSFRTGYRTKIKNIKTIFSQKQRAELCQIFKILLINKDINPIHNLKIPCLLSNKT